MTTASAPPNPWKWVTIAAFILLLASLALNYVYFGKYNNYKEKYDILYAQHQNLATDKQFYRTRSEQLEQSVYAMSDPATKTVHLPGTAPHPDATATVYWNTNSSEVYLHVNKLPLPAADKQYQLWAIVDGKPVDVGVFDISSDRALVLKMRSATNVQMFAVTLEKKGGAPAPTMEQMYVAGKVN